MSLDLVTLALAKKYTDEADARTDEQIAQAVEDYMAEHPVDFPNNAVQPDWEQTNSEKPDFIKNRPFGQFGDWEFCDFYFFVSNLHGVNLGEPMDPVKAIINGVEYAQSDLIFNGTLDDQYLIVETLDGKYKATLDQATHSETYEPDAVWEFQRLETYYKTLSREHLPLELDMAIEYAEQIGRGLRPDWDNSNPSSKEYIKNRPFYTGYVDDPLHVNSFFVETNPEDNLFLDFLMTEYPGSTIRVVWDGESYICPYSDNSNYGGYQFGDENLVNYPFFFYAYQGNGTVKSYNGSHWFDLHRVKEVVHKIPEKYLPDSIPKDSSLGITGATVGQILAVKSVDSTNKPTEWETVNIPTGGGGSGGETEWRLIRTVKIPAEEPVTGGVTITTDENGNPFELLEVAIRVKERERVGGYTYGSIKANGKFVGEERRNTPMLILIRDIGGLWTAGTMGMGYQDNGPLGNWGYNYADHNCLVNDNPTINKLHLSFTSCDMEIYGKVRK